MNPSAHPCTCALRRLALLLVLLAAACSNTAHPAPQGDIAALIGDAACDADAQCRTIGVGHKPCGGPASYAAWSTLRTDEKKLQAAAALHADAQRNHQLSEGRVSTCEAVPDPGAYCDRRHAVAGHADMCRLIDTRGAGGPSAR